MSLARGATHNLAGQALMAVASALGVILVTRVLGSEGKGAYSLVVLVPYVMMLVGSFGVGHASIYYMGQGVKIEYLVANALLLAAVAGTVLAGGFTIVVGLFHVTAVSSAQLPVVVIAAWSTPLLIVINNLSLVLLKKSTVQFNVVAVLQFALPTIGFPLFLVYWKLGVLGAVVSYVTGTALTAIGALIFLSRYTPISARFVRWRIMRKTLVFGVRAYVSFLAQFLSYRFDLFLVAYFLPLEQVGYYSIALAMAEMITRTPIAVAQALFPAVASVNRHEARVMTAGASRHTIFIVVLAVALLVVSGRTLLIAAFGPSFVAVLRPLWWLLPGMISISLFKVLSSHLTGQGRPGIPSTASAFALFLIIVLDIVLIPHGGIVAAAAVSSVSYSAAALAVVLFFLVESGSRPRDLLVIRRADFGAYRSIIARPRAEVQ